MRPSRSQASAPRRGPALLVAGLLVVVPLGAAMSGEPPSASGSLCGPAAQALPSAGGPTLCAHVDEAPPGVDVTDPVSTRELLSREGAGPTAYAAAQDLGIAASSGETTTASPAVPCDGDGTSGYRVQAMYVVEANATNRYAALVDTMKVWAAGTDDVINRSAALTGGVRHVRYVTEQGPGGTCEATVLDVTVPAGSMTSFSATVAAVRALGYTNRSRKYLMWTDARVLCGVASMYLSDGPSQSNPNNGSYPQYARVDSGCWGLGDRKGHHSVEAHELAHALGGVQGSAPHSTNAGHCWDESDTMCYADGGNHAMVAICPPEREYLLDCNTDDYFTTYAEPGSYLDTHWNAADSRFLVGGGDGLDGGSPGSPVLGATIGVNNPVVPGLSTQVSVSPSLPDGRTVTSVRWRSARGDCAFSAPGQLQSEVTCGATASGSTTVSATLVDSTGATRTVSSPLTFASGAPRPVSLSLSVSGQDTGPASVCTGAAFPVRATVTDAATGRPVKGLSTTFTRRTPAMTEAAAVGSAASQLGGGASVNATVTGPTTFGARTHAGTVYAPASSPKVSAAPARCTPVLTAGADRDELYHGETVTLSGTLTRTVGATVLPVPGASLPVRLTYPSGASTRVSTLTTARTAADGSWSATVRPTVTGALSVVLASSSAYQPRRVDVGEVTVHLPDTDLEAAVDRTDVGHGARVTVTGRLTRTAGRLTTGAVTTGLAGALSVKVRPPGRAATAVGTGRTLSDGTFAITVPLKISGTMSVAYAGAAGAPADTMVLGDVTAGRWDTAVSLSGTRSGAYLPLSGTVTRTYAGATEPARALPVRIYFTPSSTGVPTLVTTATATAAGTYTARVAPGSPGRYQAVVPGVVGHAGSSSGYVAAR